MACGMLAFQKADVKVDNYYAYEIDKYAIQTVTHNFPQIQELGDVYNADFTKYSNIDYLIGGSPCTFWSIAQSPDKRETTASGIGWELFSQYVRALHEAEPKFFIYENNKSMSAAIRQSITETFGFEPICINSALVSAQNRQRLYWVGKRNADGTYSKVDVEQPKDKGILLKDVLDAVMVAKPMNTTIDGKSQTLKAQYSNTDINNICRYTSTYGASGVAEPVISSVQVGALPRPNGELSWSQAFRVYDTNAKSVTLKVNGGGAGGKTGLYAIPVEFNGEIPVKAISAADDKTYTVYNVKYGNITIKGKTYPIKLVAGYYIIRKLTVSECKRLQTVPEWYEFPVSDTQAYKMLGNGWTVDVIAHLIDATENRTIV
jgi:DNA (cytosine-5)-methyltransferase 3A